MISRKALALKKTHNNNKKTITSWYAFTGSQTYNRVKNVHRESLSVCVWKKERKKETEKRGIYGDTGRRSSEKNDFIDFCCSGMSVQQSIWSLADLFYDRGSALLLLWVVEEAVGRLLDNWDPADSYISQWRCITGILFWQIHSKERIGGGERRLDQT